MFCPKCGDEYQPGFKVCAECHVSLVDALPVKSSLPHKAPVTVLSTRDPSVIAVAKSLLGASSIPFVATGEIIQEIMTGVGDPAEIKVPAEFARQAREELKRLEKHERTGP
jgi:hypothetical protein